jgi:hypothetical protein
VEQDERKSQGKRKSKKRQRENVVMSTHEMNEREQKKSPTKLIKKLYFLFWKLYITRYSFVLGQKKGNKRKRGGSMNESILLRSPTCRG